MNSIADALGTPPGSAPEALAALAHIPRLRRELDAAERGLIDAARGAGASWAEIAETLGLRSRQAAEQRRLRLDRPDAGAGPSARRDLRRRQRSVDNAAGSTIIALRAAAGELAAEIDAAPPSPTLGLARSTLRIAADSDPGCLVDLARWTLADLDGAAPLPTSVAHRAETVRSIIESI
ncbi:MAG TPA: hypothetical protein VGJ28_07470 [Micromonosporaceae bacterium]|jgi:hypothetical protein